MEICEVTYPLIITANVNECNNKLLTVKLIVRKYCFVINRTNKHIETNYVSVIWGWL